MRFGFAVALLLAVSASTAAAQDPVFFAEGGPTRNRDLPLSGHATTGGGISAGAGVRLGDRTEIRGLVDMPASSFQTQTSAVLLTRLIPVGRVTRLTASAGWSSNSRPDGATGQPQGGPIVAAGAIVPLSAHVAFVPEVRAVVYPTGAGGAAGLRTGVNARWRF